MKKSKKLSSEIGKVIVLAMTVSMLLLMFCAASVVRTNIMPMTLTVLENSARNNADEVQSIIVSGEKGTSGLADAISGIDYVNESGREKFINSALERRFNAEIEASSEVYGVFCEFEPYAFAKDTEGFTSYYYYEDGEMLHETVTEDDPTDYTREDYYIETKRNNAVTVSEPYMYDFDNGSDSAMMITVASPIRNSKGDFIGLVGYDILLNSLSEKLISNSEMFSDYYCYIASRDKVCAAHSYNSKEVGELIKTPSVAVDGKDGFYYGTCEITGGESYVAANKIIAGGKDTGWVSYVSVSKSNIEKTSLVIAAIVFALGILITVVLTIMIMTILKKKLRPISEVIDASEKLSDGNLDIKLTINSNDEIGMAANAINELSDSLRSYVSEINNVVKNISKGELNIETSDMYKGDFIEIKESLDLIISSLNSSMRRITNSAASIKNDVSQVSYNSNALAHNSEAEAADAENLVKIVNQLTQVTMANAESAKSIDNISNKSKAAISDGNLHMQELCEAMTKISVDSDEIAKIVKAIDDIAFQTNILALNASVEAARAGKYGKGFSVVAEEVGNLANRSAEASNQTAQLVANSQKNVSQGVSLAKRTSESMQEISGEIQQVVEIAETISSSASEQSKAIDTVNNFIVKINDNMQKNVASAEESAASVDNLLGQTKLLDSLVSEYNLNQ